MQKVTRKDISEYIRKYIKDKPYVAGMIINEEMNKQLKPSEFFTNLKSF
jgi:zinc protease